MSNRQAVLLLVSATLVVALMTFIIIVNRKDRGFMIRQCSTTETKRDNVRWDKKYMPLRLIMTPGSGDWLSLFEMEGERWNDRTGLSLFQRPEGIEKDITRFSCADEGAPPDPVVFVHETIGDGMGNGSAHARLRYDENCKLRCVDLYVPGQVEDQFRKHVVAHELGHSLGLEHTEKENALMYPTLQFGGSELTEAAQKALEQAYGNQ